MTFLRSYVLVLLVCYFLLIFVFWLFCCFSFFIYSFLLLYWSTANKVEYIIPSCDGRSDRRTDVQAMTANTACKKNCKYTVTISLVLFKWNLTPTRTPAITMATTNAHVTPMITCLRLTRDFFPSAFSTLSLGWNVSLSNKQSRLRRRPNHRNNNNNNVDDGNDDDNKHSFKNRRILQVNWGPDRTSRSVLPVVCIN